MKRVKEFREAKGWSQTQLAALAGMSTSGVSQIESGKRNLSISTLRRIARALGVRVSDLLEEE